MNPWPGPQVLAALAALAGACSHDWNAYDPARADATTSATTMGQGPGPAVAGASGSASSSASVSSGGRGGSGGTPGGNGGARPDGGPTYADEVMADAPVGYWRLDEASGNVAKDAMGNHDAAVIGGLTFGVPGALVGDPNTAAEFDGVSAVVVLNDLFDFPGMVPFTVECWLKPNNLDMDYRRVFSKETSSANGRQGYLLYVQAATEPNPVGFERWLDDVPLGAAKSAVALDPNVFTHLVARFDGVLTALFVDGAEVAVVPDVGSMLDTNGAFVWGAHSSFYEFVGGVFDELAIYDKALDDARIAAHHATGVGAK